MIKLLAIDMDGTCLDSRSRMREVTLQALEQAVAAYSKIYVEIFAKDASKGNALKHSAEKLHISKHEIAYIGGGENDLSAFREVGYRFAMGNAVPELKEKAEVVLPGNDENVMPCIWSITARRLICKQELFSLCI